MLTDIPCNICRAEDKSALIYLTCLCLHRPLAKVQQKTRKAPFFNHRGCRDGKKGFPGLRELRRCYHATLEKLLSNFSVLLLRSSLEIDEASDLRTLEVRKGVWGRGMEIGLAMVFHRANSGEMGVAGQRETSLMYL